jgi:hypothetical protein
LITTAALTVLLTACSSGGGSPKTAKATSVSPSASASPSVAPSTTPSSAAPAAVAVGGSAPKVVPFSAQPNAGAQAPTVKNAPGPGGGLLLPASTGRTVLAIQGTDSKSSPTFTVPASWAINFAYDCTNAPDNTNFQIFPTGSDPNRPVTTVNEITEQGSGTQKYTVAGTYYLVVNTMCNWKISVTD